MIRINRTGKAALSTALAIAASALMAACSGHAGSATSSVLPSTGGAQSGVRHNTVTNIYGGGSTLASLLYRQWFDYYGVAMPPDPQGQSNGQPVNPNYLYYYAGIGSGAGRAAFISQTPSTVTPASSPIYCPNGVTSCYPYPVWHYSGSDATLSSTEISCYQVGCPPTYPNPAQPARGQYVQIPTLATAITNAYNPTGQTVGSKGLNLSRNSYCGIWEGAIQNWGDAGITSDNGGHQVSTQPIIRVVRADKSGTTALLTAHLSAVCVNLSNPAYDWTGGSGGLITWPPGSPVVQGTDSSGVVSAIQANSGSIGYVGPSFVAPVVPGGLPTANLQNQYYFNLNKLVFEPPTVQKTLNGFKGINPPSNPDPFDLAIQVPNPPNQNAYPIVGYTWLLAYQCYQTSTEASSMVGFIKWYAMPGTVGGTPADKILIQQGLAPLNGTWKKAVRTIAPNIVAGPINNVCTI